ncbi:MAG: redoxin domain-containing protein [Aureispira sp.]|nr:redoxin domain-containing protein [Aureispira sp.]
MKNLWILLLSCCCSVGLFAQEDQMPGKLKTENTDGDLEQKLFYAIWEKDYDAVVNAVNSGASLKKRYTYEKYSGECKTWSVMHAAAAVGDIKIFKYLHQQGGNINDKLPNGEDGKEIHQGLFTPLHLAAGYHSIEVLEYLLEKGVDADVKANWNRTPLVHAIRSHDYDNLDVVKILVKNGADINVRHAHQATPLFDACTWGKYEMAEFLLEKGADPNAMSRTCSPYSSYKVPPMFCAIWWKKNELLPLLYDHGANLNPDIENSMLHQAADCGNLYAAAFLIKRRAKRDVVNNEGKTALDVAKEKGNASMIYLLKNGKLSEKDAKIQKLMASDAFKHFKPAGRKAPELKLSDINGNPVSIDDYKGKVVILNIWATWCPPCLREMPHFKTLKEKVGRDVVILASSIDRELSKVKDFSKNNDYPFTYLHDPKASLRSSYGGAVPATFVIGPDGVIQSSVDGSLDWSKDEYKEYINLLLED